MLVESTMTTTAHEALRDCEAALEDLRSGVGQYWRTRWVSTVTLLRTVGHVLDKVDGERSPELRAAIDAAHARLKATKPEPKIYWEFIVEGRNRLVKELEFRVQQNVTVRLGGVWFNMATGESGGDPPGPTTYDHLVVGGSFAGQDPRDVVQMAIEWWVSYLDKIDELATELPVSVSHRSHSG
jgi:hypothetical protein